MRGGRFISGSLQQILLRLFTAHVFFIILLHFKNWNRSIGILRKMQKKMDRYRVTGTRRLAIVDGGIYWDMYSERWPSPGFVRSVIREARQADEGAEAHTGIRTVLFGITTKCALRCEHCFEWDNLNLKERLTLQDLDRMISHLLDYGATQIHLSGGEPMMRFDDIITLLNKHSRRASFWIITSGFHVTKERAVLLKQAGLRGMAVSIDSHEVFKHDKFRHFDGAFEMASQAVYAANEAGLVTTLSLCTVQEYVSRENLEAYMEMAKAMKVSFVQLLEPRAVGHYRGISVQLDENARQVLADTYLRFNSKDGYPMVVYHEFYRSTLGCSGAGAGSMYIDPLGAVHACPFCRNSVGNLLNDSVKDCIDRLRSDGCPIEPLPEIKKSKLSRKLSPTAVA